MKLRFELLTSSPERKNVTMQKQSPPLGAEPSIHLKVDTVRLSRHDSNFVSDKNVPV